MVAAAAARLTELREDAYTKILKCFVKQAYDMVRRSVQHRPGPGSTLQDAHVKEHTIPHTSSRCGNVCLCCDLTFVRRWFGSCLECRSQTSNA